MSQSSVLFDAPGPRTIARHRAYTVVAIVTLLAALAFALWRLQATGQLAYEKWEPFVTPRYIRAILVDGLVKTLEMAAVAVVLAVVFGLIFGVGKLSDHRPVRWFCWLVVEFFRAVPVLMLMILGFFAIFRPISDVDSRAYWSVILALTLYNGAVLAEVFRAGCNAVPKGQGEAADAIGMRKSHVLRKILHSQGLELIVHSLLSTGVVMLEGTILRFYILAPGLTALVKPLYQGFNNHVAVIIVIGGLYVVINLLLTMLATWVQRRFVGERKILQVAMVGEQDDAKA